MSPDNFTPQKHQTRVKKIARIWCLARDMGFSKDKNSELYLVVESVTGKNSISQLDMLELDMVSRSLKSLLYKQNRKKYLENSRNRKSGTAFMPTPKQRQLIKDYLDKLTGIIGLNDPDAYIRYICSKTLNKDYQKLNRDDTKQLIEILKSIYKRNKEAK